MFAAPVLLQIDDFEDGTTENWFAGGGPGGQTWPVTNIADGGPAGPGDNFLLLTSTGSQGAGGKLVAQNAAQWAGDYIASGITSIEMDVRNFGQTSLALRLLFEDPVLAPPSNLAISTNELLLPAQSLWTHVTFLIGAGDLTALAGSVDAVLSNTTVLRLFHSPTPTFPGPPLASVLGVDNVTATAIPEPGTALLVSAGVAALTRYRRQPRRRVPDAR
jgi:hypothetical protein